MERYTMLINQKKSEVDMLISDKTDFRTGKIVWDNEGYYIMMKGLVHQRHKNLVCVCF